MSARPEPDREREPHEVAARLLAYLDEQAATADRHWRLVRRTAAVDAVHDFRVAVKRLRAFDGLCCRLDGMFARRGQLKAARRLFRTCGPLRDVHVQQQLVLGSSGAALPGLSEYYNHLKRLELGARDEVARAAEGTPRVALDRYRAAVADRLAGLAPETILARAEKHVACSLAVLTGPPRAASLDPVLLHQLRIDAKRTRYALEILMSCRPPRERLQVLNESLLSVHRALGLWHDHQVGAIYLDRFLAEREGRLLAEPAAHERLAAWQRERREEALDLFRVRWSFLQHTVASGSLGLDVLLGRPLSSLA